MFAGKPVITYDEKLKSAQKLKAGSTLTISVNVAGTPTPKVSWLQAGEPVAATSIDTKDNYSTLTVKNVTSKLAGQIQVKAENKVGSDSAEFTVEIKGSFSWYISIFESLFFFWFASFQFPQCVKFLRRKFSFKVGILNVAANSLRRANSVRPVCQHIV